jgi:hypothetical protein
MKFVVDGKKDEVVGVIMTYISWEIQFHKVNRLSSSSLEEVEVFVQQSR